jgi:hypothetical protein
VTVSSSLRQSPPSTGATVVKRRRPPSAWALVILELTVAANALLGGIELIRTGFGIPLDWLARTPFTTWSWPGGLLIVTVALPHAAAAAAALVRTRWWPRIGWIAGSLAGLSLLAWIGVQVIVLQHYFVLQPVVAAIGIAELVLARLWRRHSE